MKTLKPKCLNGKPVGHTARGYILPCCHWDIPNLFESEIKNLVEEKFKLEDLHSVEDVIESKEWKNFYEQLELGRAPLLCYEYCSDNNIKDVL